MALWWIADVIFLLLVVPVVVILLRRAFQAAMMIKKTVDVLAAAGPVLISHLDGVPQLVQTQQLVHETSAGLARYGAALDEIL